MLWFAYAFCSIFIVVGAGMTYHATRSILKGRAIEGWPAAEAQITHCELKNDHDSEGGNSYEVVVRYDYKVGNKQYTNDKVHPVYAGSSFDGHKVFYDKLKNCSVVRIRYNELKPDESYLITGWYSSALATVFGGLLFFSLGLLFLLVFHFAIAGNSNYAAGLDIVR